MAQRALRWPLGIRGEQKETPASWSFWCARFPPAGRARGTVLSLVSELGLISVGSGAAATSASTHEAPAGRGFLESAS